MRKIKLDKKGKELLLQSNEHFKKVFGRDPRPEDPVFWDERYTDYPRPMTEERLIEVMENAIRKACKKLGFSEEKTQAAIYTMIHAPN